MMGLKFREYKTKRALECCPRLGTDTRGRETWTGAGTRSRNAAGGGARGHPGARAAAAVDSCQPGRVACPAAAGVRARRACVSTPQLCRFVVWFCHAWRGQVANRVSAGVAKGAGPARRMGLWAMAGRAAAAAASASDALNSYHWVAVSVGLG
jgi:hypothetical protein